MATWGSARQNTRRTMKDRMAQKIPGISWLADMIRRVAQLRRGRIPVGLLALLPVAFFIDFFDSPLDLLGGPVTLALGFVLETSFVLGITGRTSYALAFSGIDLIPGVDLIPFATITLLNEIRKAWRAQPSGDVIDVPFRPASP